MQGVDDRTKEKLEHLSTVCSQVDQDKVQTMVVAVATEALDAECCDMHRLLLIQKACSHCAEAIMGNYLRRRNNATRN